LLYNMVVYISGRGFIQGGADEPSRCRTDRPRRHSHILYCDRMSPRESSYDMRLTDFSDI